MLQQAISLSNLIIIIIFRFPFVPLEPGASTGKSDNFPESLQQAVSPPFIMEKALALTGTGHFWDAPYSSDWNLILIV